MKKSIKIILLFTSVVFTKTAFAQVPQQSEYYRQAAVVIRQAEAKTACPERARVLEEYAKWNDRMVRSLADPTFSAGPQPTTPIPPCDGDMIGGSNGNSSGTSTGTGSSKASAGTDQVQAGMNAISALQNAASSLGPAVKFNIEGEYGSTFDGDLGIYFTQGIGVSGKIEVPLSKTVNLGFGDLEEILNVGSAAQRFHNLQPSYNFNVPKLSLKYYLTDVIYVEAEGGYAVSASSDLPSGVALSGGLGFDFGAFELGGRYDSWGSNSEITQIAFHLGIRF